MKRLLPILAAVIIIPTTFFYLHKRGTILGDESSPSKEESLQYLDQSPLMNESDVAVPEYPSEEYLRVILTPLRRTMLSTEVAVSTVQKINKRMGDSFNKGDVLIQLNKTNYEALFKKAEANLEKAKTNADAKEELFKDNIASSVELQVARSELAIAEADVEAAKRALEETSILAPYDGKVVNLFVEEHELIQQGKPLIEIVEDKVLIGKVLVPSTMLDKLKLGKEIKVKIRETDTVVPAKITRIEPVIDPASSMLKVDIEINNEKGELRGGMIGLARFR